MGHAALDEDEDGRAVDEEDLDGQVILVKHKGTLLHDNQGVHLHTDGHHATQRGATPRTSMH